MRRDGAARRCPLDLEGQLQDYDLAALGSNPQLPLIRKKAVVFLRARPEVFQLELGVVGWNQN